MLATVLALLAAQTAASPPDAGAVAAGALRVDLSAPMTNAQRRELVKTTTRAEQERLLVATPPELLIATSRRCIEELGTYRYRLRKQERVKGELLEAQDIDATVRETPFAIRLDFVGGPAKGRRVLYNSALRKGEFRVKEAGFLGIAGAVWLDVDSGMAKGDSNHTVVEAGLGNLVRRLDRDLARAKAQGGVGIKHEGWDDQGRYCTMYTMPNQGQGFSAPLTRICTDLAEGIPGRVESYDLKNTLLEKYESTSVQPVKLEAKYFTVDGAGL